MSHRLLAVVASLLLIAGSAVPSTAAMGGHVGHFQGGHFHHGHFHHGGCCFGAFFGGVVVGAALAFPWYPYPYPYYYPYPAYSVATAVAPPVVSYQQPAASYRPAPVAQQQAVQREVVHPTGKYVLYGDGVTQPWQWYWFPAQQSSAVAARSR
jgi:hypothetical protein